MTDQEFFDLTPQQRKSMVKLQDRSGIQWEEFLESAQPPSRLFPYVGIPNFHGMFVGIEENGYTHS